MPTTLDIRSLSLTSGARLGLAESTLSCVLRLNGSPGQDPAEVERRLRGILGQLWPEETLPFFQPGDWPGRFQIPGTETRSLGAWCIALTIALQRLSRDPVGRGRVVATQDQQYHIAIPWIREGVANKSLTTAVDCIGACLSAPDAYQRALTRIGHSLRTWLSLAQERNIAPNTYRFAMAARDQGIPVRIRYGVLYLGWGHRARWMDSSLTDRTSQISVRLARFKNSSMALLRESGIPTPESRLVETGEKAVEAASSLGYPVVIKPAHLDQGQGVVPGIRNQIQLLAAFEKANELCPEAVMVEKHVEGHDHRLLVVGGQLMMATQRVPATVTGDGLSSIRTLIDQLNADVRRGKSKRSLLMYVECDEEASACLEEQGYDFDSMLPLDRSAYLRRTANISTGGTAIDVSQRIHPDNRIVAERCAVLLGLDIAGVDFLCPDISRSWREVGGGVCEVNAQPGFRPHWLSCPDRDINGEIVARLFSGRPCRIPTLAWIGDQCPTPALEILHGILSERGLTTGLATRDYTLFGKDRSTTQAGDILTSDAMLGDPSMEYALFGLTPDQLQRQGHPCDRYDIVALDIDPGSSDADRQLISPALRRQSLDAIMRATGHLIIPAWLWPTVASLRSKSSAHWILLATPPEPEAVSFLSQSAGQIAWLNQAGQQTELHLSDGQNIDRLNLQGHETQTTDTRLWITLLEHLSHMVTA